VREYALANRNDGVLVHGLLQHPEDFWPAVGEQQVTILGPDNEHIQYIGEVDWSRVAVAASDGSSDNHVIPDVSRAACAVAFYTSDMEHVCTIGCTLAPEHRQTAPIAEQVGATLAEELIENEWILFSDNATVVKTLGSSWQQQVSHKLNHAGIRRLAMTLPGSSKLLQAVHVRAHRTDDQLAQMDEETRQASAANEIADQAAKMVREQLHTYPTSEQLKSCGHRLKMQKYVLSVMAEVLPLYPPIARST
jgi:ribonuclease HI